MGSSVRSSGISLDIPDPVFDRLLIEGKSKVNIAGERSPFTVQEQNSGLDQVSSPLRREVVNRSLSTMKSLSSDEIDLEDGKIEKDRSKTTCSKRVVKFQNQAVFSGLAYCISSCSMILVNKFVLSSYDFNAGISLMLYQASYLQSICLEFRFSGHCLHIEVFWYSLNGTTYMEINQDLVACKFYIRWDACHKHFQLSGSFLLVLNPYILVWGFSSLKYINVAMVTVLKNVTNVITALGEMYLFNKHHESRVWAALFLMIISAVSGGITDLSFHAVGYTWQIINCFLTASYSLTLRRVMDTAKQVTKSGNLNEFSMVLLNNILSLPLGFLLIFVFNEVDYLFETPLLRMPSFWFVITSSGFLGLAISFTSMWFLHQTSATTYSLVGSLNKIPLSIAGILLFKVPTSLENFASILFGLLAGVLFTRAKMREKS
ncbi:hypothetical protein GIB67_029809 [Kingdonia uniflora]|uniref:Sugar phosphate transporter domain-containing protein n=1 Tax=Kingdonia uniflora TaxID=39325 RepID=A0A7J7NIU2_9MAGN|nr:hypothetical protein GIB67_029809 [Kingdonia uniflora]